MNLHKNSNHLLVVDDDVRIRSLLQKYLIEQGYFVSIAKDANQALKILQEIECNLIILDVMMPDETGIEFAKKLRNVLSINIPIIMLTAMGQADDRINGLEVGANDYLVKPFEPKELLLRINNILKYQSHHPEISYFGSFSYNFKTYCLQQNNEIIFLTSSENFLLNFLLKNINIVISREQLAQELNINERSVDVQIIRLRNKIEINSSRPQFLQTIRNKGYIFRK